MAEPNVAVVDPNTPANTPAPGGEKPVVNAPVQQPEKTYSFKEDRSDWVPRTRLNEESGKAKELERKFNELQARLEDQDKRVKTVFGIDAPSKEQTDQEEMRAAIRQLGFVDGLTKEEIEELREAAQQARETVLGQSTRHAQQLLDDISDEVASELGVQALSDRQQRGLYHAYLQEARAAHETRKAAFERGERASLETQRSDKDFLARHDRGDKTLIKEFAKEFLNDWYEPARRSAQSAITRRNRPLPSGERSRMPVTSKQPDIDYSSDDAFKKALIEARAGG